MDSPGTTALTCQQPPSLKGEVKGHLRGCSDASVSRCVWKSVGNSLCVKVPEECGPLVSQNHCTDFHYVNTVEAQPPQRCCGSETPQPTSPASALPCLTDLSEVQTKDGGSCGDPTTGHAAQAAPVQGPHHVASPRRTPSRGFSEKDPVTWLLREGPRHVASLRRTPTCHMASPRRTPIKWLL